MPTRNKPRLALALGGGAAWCIAHIGVLQAFEEAGITVDAVAGTSGGSVVGALYADGAYSPDDIAELAARSGILDFIRPTVPRTGFFDSDGTGRFMTKHLRAGLIEEMRLPFAAVAVDLGTGEKVTLMKGPAPEAVQASCSIPIIFTPTIVDGRTLIDGGLVSAVPVDSAREELGADIVVAVNVQFRANEKPKLDSMQGIAFHLALQFLKTNTAREITRADMAINVPVDGIEPYELKKHDELIRRGRDAAEKVIDEVRALRV